MTRYSPLGVNIKTLARGSAISWKLYAACTSPKSRGKAGRLNAFENWFFGLSPPIIFLGIVLALNNARNFLLAGCERIYSVLKKLVYYRFVNLENSRTSVSKIENIMRQFWTPYLVRRCV